MLRYLVSPPLPSAVTVWLKVALAALAFSWVLLMLVWLAVVAV